MDHDHPCCLCAFDIGEQCAAMISPPSQGCPGGLRVGAWVEGSKGQLQELDPAPLFPVPAAGRGPKRVSWVGALPHLVEGPVGAAHLDRQSRLHIPPRGQAAHGAATASDSGGGSRSSALSAGRAWPPASPRRRSRRGSRGGREPGRPHGGPATANEQGAGAGPLPVRRRRLGLRHREGNGRRRRRCLRHLSFRPPPAPLLPQSRDPPLPLHGLHLPLPPPLPPTAQAHPAPARRARG